MNGVLYVLFFYLLVFLLYAMRKAKKYLISPAVVFCGSYIIAVLVCMMNTQWDFTMSLMTALLIGTVLGIFFLGQSLAEKFFVKIKLRRNRTENYGYKVKKYTLYVMFILQMFLFVYYLLFIIEIGQGVSVSTITVARSWMLNNEIPNIYGHVNHLSFSIAAVYIFVLVRQIFVERKKKNIVLYIGIVALYIFMEIMGTSRSGLIYLLGYIMTIVVYFFQQYLKIKGVTKEKQKKKVIAIVVRIAIITILMFIVLGTLTGKTDRLGIVNMVSTYFGGSLYNLEYYLNHQNDFVSPSFGYFTLPLWNTISRIFGMEVVVLKDYYFPMHLIPMKNGIAGFSPTNLYTCIVRPMTDYGLFGGCLFFLILGTFYGYVYKSVYRSKQPGLVLIYYGLLVMPLVGASAEYLFGTMIFAPYTVYRIIYIFVLFNLCIEKVRNRNGEQNETFYSKNAIHN